MTIKDSGNRREFNTGAVRDMQEGKGRCDLMPLRQVADCFVETNRLNYIILTSIAGAQECIREKEYSLAYETCERVIMLFTGKCRLSLAELFLEVSKHYEEGAKKYGEYNWQKGIPFNSYIDSAVRHYLKYVAHYDDERHDRAFVWNMLGLMYEIEKAEEEE